MNCSRDRRMYCSLNLWHMRLGCDKWQGWDDPVCRYAMAWMCCQGDRLLAMMKQQGRADSGTFSASKRFRQSGSSWNPEHWCIKGHGNAGKLLKGLGYAGVGLQVLQQAAGINTIMYFTVRPKRFGFSTYIGHSLVTSLLDPSSCARCQVSDQVKLGMKAYHIQQHSDHGPETPSPATL